MKAGTNTVLIQIVFLASVFYLVKKGGFKVKYIKKVLSYTKQKKNQTKFGTDSNEFETLNIGFGPSEFHFLRKKIKRKKETVFLHLVPC